jgi:hypothetical protein
MISRSALRSFAPPSVLSLSNGPDISPARGEIGSFSLPASPAPLTGETKAAGAISPLAGEMSGRTEGGAKERNTQMSSQEHRP